MNDPLDRREAMRIVLALRSGAASSKAARAITVGTDDIERRLMESVCNAVAASAADRFVVVSADWGFGKSHLRTLLAARLFTDCIPFVSDCIDGRASSLSHMHRVMPRWLEQMQIGSNAGLREAFLQAGLSTDSALAWAESRYDPFARGLLAALSGMSAGWLLALGHNYRTPDYSYQHPKAVGLLYGCAELLAHQGRGPVVVLLDEMENVDKQYNICGRRNSYATLARLVRHPHILPIMFVTPRFFSQVEDDHRHGIRNLWYGWFPEAKHFVQTMPQQAVLTPSVFSRQMADDVVDRIASVFSVAYDYEPSNFVADEVVDAWSRSPSRSIRFLVRLAISEMDIRHQAVAASARNGHRPRIGSLHRAPVSTTVRVTTL